MGVLYCKLYYYVMNLFILIIINTIWYIILHICNHCWLYSLQYVPESFVIFTLNTCKYFISSYTTLAMDPCMHQSLPIRCRKFCKGWSYSWGTGNAELIALCPSIYLGNKCHNAKVSIVRILSIHKANLTSIMLRLTVIIDVYKGICCLIDILLSWKEAISTRFPSNPFVPQSIDILMDLNFIITCQYCG